MIDCHNHTLPSLDDGARDIDYALAMAGKALQAGIRTVIATPHHLNGVYSNPRKRILRSVLEFRTALAEAGIPLEIFPGSELHLVPELPDRLLEGEALTFADHGKAALIELPKHTVPTGTETILEKLLSAGITPIIAHPERNTTLLMHPDRAAEWVDMGCKLQLTAQSCAGDFGTPIQNACRQWCRQGLVHLIASDAHRTVGRPPDIRSGAVTIQDWMNEEAMYLLTEINPKRLIRGENLLDLEPVEGFFKKRIIGFERLLRAKP